MVSIGTIVIFFLGLPGLLVGSWFGYYAFRGDCFVFLLGPTMCGNYLYLFSFIGFFAFVASLVLARLWKD